MVGEFDVATTIAHRGDVVALVESVVDVEKETIAVVGDDRSGSDVGIYGFHLVACDGAHGVAVGDVVEVA